MKNILWFKEVGINDIPKVGGKNASLGEMYQNLASEGVKVPNGFAVTAGAYYSFIEENNLDNQIQEIITSLDKHDVKKLQAAGKRIRHLIMEAQLSEQLKKDILAAYHELGGKERYIEVAVRSSATAEDLPDASFAGQQETYLNIHGDEAILHACKSCYASLFTDRAISYRYDRNFSDVKIALSIGIQRMVRSDLASSGVMFSIDTESGFKDVVLINAAYGLGENVVQGSVNPDEYYIYKPKLKEGFKPIIQKRIGSKELKLIYNNDSHMPVKNVSVSKEEQANFALTDDEIMQLAKWACAIEDHYSRKKDGNSPMDIEWAKDGRTGELFIVQARPETVHSQKTNNMWEKHNLKNRGNVLVSGSSVGQKIATGKVKLVRSIEELSLVEPGDILVTDQTDPDWEPAMKKASAIVTNRGGRTCHAAIVSREIGIPAVVGALDATKNLKEGQEVTVSCAEGDTGYVYEGKLEFTTTSVELSSLPEIKTNLMINLANPDEALSLAQLPVKGVGLARMEFIINNFIKVHPLALINFDRLEDQTVKAKIAELTQAYDDKKHYFIDKLAQGVGMIAAAFAPHDVILRLSDFKTNEYANLLGGAPYEPHEHNPMIGFRGASRYYSEQYKDGFALECEAVKKVRDEMGITNLKVMIPFCRTVEEGKKVISEMKHNGLVQGENGLEVYVMCEIPSNAILAEEFADVFDGFSIGSNDLTQLSLGIDRDSELLADLFNERDSAVKKLITMAIKGAKSKGRKIGICGQAPSDFPEFTEFLVEQGIDSISLTPDVVVQTIPIIAEAEKRVGR